mgnify:CR=1 FL=1
MKQILAELKMTFGLNGVKSFKYQNERWVVTFKKGEPLEFTWFEEMYKWLKTEGEN